jgi:NADH-quinone oxidoreductase subunit B
VRPEALLEGLMRVQDKVRKMRDLTKGDRAEIPIPTRSGNVALPPELADPEKALAFLTETKERAKPVKA